MPDAFIINKTANSDHPFSQQELQKALKISTDTVPGLDKITSMLSHLSPQALDLLFLLFNKSLAVDRLPQAGRLQPYSPFSNQANFLAAAGPMTTSVTGKHRSDSKALYQTYTRLEMVHIKDRDTKPLLL